MPFPISGPLEPLCGSLMVSEIFNVECNAMVDMTSIRPQQRSRSFILVPTDYDFP